MHVKNSMILLLFISIFFIVHGQLSLDELFFFNSKYTSTDNCTDFQYQFPHFRMNNNTYNQLIFNCNSSNIIFRNTDQISSSFCSNDEYDLKNFRIYFHDLSQTFIQANQLHFHGIELCSLDDFIQKTYSEYSYYRSQWALLINLETNNKQEQHHLAIATNDEMTFILFIISSKYSTNFSKNSIELIFPNENIFQFNRSLINIWRIDRGFVHIPQSLENVITYQLSKSKFTLYNDETFLLYGTEILNPRRIAVYIDNTLVQCVYDHILQCTFPILPLEIHDSHKPLLQVIYNLREIFSANLTLNPRIRLGQIPTNHSITNIETYNITLDTNLCTNESLKSLFTLIIHLRTEDINGTKGYQNIVKDDLPPIDCNTTYEIGRKIKNLTQPILINDITSLIVDLKHEWYGHENCRSERTRINFN